MEADAEAEADDDAEAVDDAEADEDVEADEDREAEGVCEAHAEADVLLSLLDGEGEPEEDAEGEPDGEKAHVTFPSAIEYDGGPPPHNSVSLGLQLLLKAAAQEARGVPVQAAPENT